MQNVLQPGLQFAGIVALVSIGYGTAEIAFACGMAFVAVAAVSIVLLYRGGEFSAGDLVRQGLIMRYRELLAFSVPLSCLGSDQRDCETQRPGHRPH